MAQGLSLVNKRWKKGGVVYDVVRHVGGEVRGGFAVMGTYKSAAEASVVRTRENYIRALELALEKLGKPLP